MLRFLDNPLIMRSDDVRDENDTSHVMLSKCFTLLVDYVEICKADEWQVLNAGGSRPSWWNFIWWRHPELGLKRLHEESQVKLPDGIPSEQSKLAVEVVALYHWWKETRPSREDPFDQVVMINEEERYADLSDIDKAEKLNTAYANEDQKMLERLIKIREHLYN